MSVKDLSQDRHHTEFYANENDTVRDLQSIM